MGRYTKVYDAADGSATPGRVFTASIGLEQIQAGGAFLHFLSMGLKAQIGTTAIPIETVVGTVSLYNLFVGADTRISLNLRQLCALMLAYYGQLPFIWENTDATGNNFIGGVRIPVYAPAKAEAPITHAADWVTQTNQTAETLAIDAYWGEGDAGKKPVHAVRIQDTTPATAGFTSREFTMPKVGMLKHLILQTPNVFADGNIDTSIQRAALRVNGERKHQFNALASHYGWAGRSVGVLDPMDDLMNIFQIIDFPEGVDLKADEVKLEIDVQDVSDACVYIPVIELA